MAVGDLPLLLLSGGLVIDGTEKMARPVLWPKFFHDVSMDLVQCLVGVNYLGSIGVHAIYVRIYLFETPKTDLI